MKKLISFTIFTLLITFSFHSCFLSNWRKEKGNGEIVSKVYEIKDYTSISASGSVEIIYEQKEDSPYLKLETDSNMFDYIDVDSDGTELKIELSDEAKPTKLLVYTNSPELFKARLSGSGTLNLRDSISVQSLSITCSGAHKVLIDKLETAKLNIEGAGASSVIINDLIANKLIIEGRGSMKVEAEGKVNDAVFDISGSGKIEALNLQTQTTKCEISGSGNVNIDCAKELNISISGSGKVKYKGDARVSQDISGSGKVERL